MLFESFEMLKWIEQQQQRGEATYVGDMCMSAWDVDRHANFEEITTVNMPWIEMHVEQQHEVKKICASGGGLRDR
jgi:hypothetical protein